MHPNIKQKIRTLFQSTGVANLGASNGNNLGIGDSPFLSRLFESTDLATFFNTAFKSAIVIGAMLAVLRLGYAGFMYMTSDVWSNKEKARGIIQDTVLGLLLLLSIWLILNQINPNILNLDILRSVSPVSSSVPSSAVSQTPASPTTFDPFGINQVTHCAQTCGGCARYCQYTSQADCEKSWFARVGATCAPK